MATTDSLAHAQRPEDVFGELTGSRDDMLREVKRVYRQLARAVHPDANPGHEDEFKRLSRLYDTAVISIRDGTYGTAKAAVVDPVLVRTKRRAFKVSRLVAHGDSCNVYATTYDHEGAPQDGLVKVVRDRRDNDLVANEAKTLKALLSDPDTFDEFSPYLPSYLETFGYRTKGDRKARQAVAFKQVPNLYTFEQVRARYPNGVHPKDMAWMFRRLMFCLGFVGKAGYVHGAVLPQHVLIEPAEHGIVLIDWKYAVQSGEQVKAISAPYREWYPPEVLAKKPALPGTDIFMAVRCMVYLLGGDPVTFAVPEHVPKRLRAFFRGSTFESVKVRPQDAHGLAGEFTELIETMWGPRKFRPFTV